jgi:integrase
MPHEPSVRLLGGRDEPTLDDTGSATILAFPAPEVEHVDPATALERIVASLTRKQTHLLAAEIEALTAALDFEPHTDPALPEGIRQGHSRRCHFKLTGGSCSCEPSYEASVYSRLEKTKVRKTFTRKQDAISWRRSQLGLADTGQLRKPTRVTLAETGRTWLAMAEAGEILNRSGDQYKPSTLRTIEQDLRLRLIPELGPHAMSDIYKTDLQRLVGKWSRQKLSASKIHATISAAQVLWRDFDLITGTDNLLANDPTHGLRLPAVRGRRDRIATSEEAHRLITALKDEDQALWGCAMYAGLRHGEIRALQVDDIALTLSRIEICRGWDQHEGEINPKTEKGNRPTVIIKLLDTLLRRHLERTGRTGKDLVFGRTATQPFNSNTVNNRARKAWKEAREREDEEDVIPERERITAIGLHECRHTAVSHMLDAGLTIDKVSKFMGHSSITVTIDRYGHLLPGGEAEAAALLDTYHERRRR